MLQRLSYTKKTTDTKWPRLPTEEEMTVLYFRWVFWSKTRHRKIIQKRLEQSTKRFDDLVSLCL